MTHIFRKHGQMILAFLGCLLMVVWLLPNKNSGGSETGGTPVGTLNGKTVLSRDLRSAAFDLSLLGNLHAQVLGMLDGNTDNQAIHWYLLLQEANKAGIAASEADITEQLNGLATMLGKSNTDIPTFLERQGITQGQLRLTFAHAIMVSKLVSLAMQAIPASLPEIEYNADRNFSTVQVRYATLDIDQSWQNQPEPTDAEIQKQFDLYKDVISSTVTGTAPGTVDGHTYPFGYKYPNRVKLEYIRFDRAPLLAAMKPTAADYEQAFRYYTANQEEFPNSKHEATVGVGSTQPAFLPFEQVSEQLVSDQVAKRVSALLKKITDRALAIAGEPWKDATTAKGYREGVAENQWADYPGIVQALHANREFQGYQPEYVTRTGWLDHSALASLAGIGKAALQTEHDTFAFPDLALHVHELSDVKDAMTHLYLQKGTEGPLLSDKEGNLYMYRVVDTQAAHAPESLSEVREQVIVDLKKLAAYKQKKADAAKLAELARTQDFAAAAVRFHVEVHATEDLSRANEESLQTVIAPGFTNAAFSLVAGSSSTQPAAGATPTTTLDQDAAFKVYVLALSHYTPIDAAKYAENRVNVVNMLNADPMFLSSPSALIRSVGAPAEAADTFTKLHIDNRLLGIFLLRDVGAPPGLVVQLRGRDFALSWLSLEAVAKRMNYVPKNPFVSHNDET